MSDFNLPKILAEVNKRLADCEAAPDWANQDNLLAKVEAIRLKALQDILALGFEFEEVISVDVSFAVADSRLIHLANELEWHTDKHGWIEPACKTTGGEIMIYFEPEQAALW